MRPEEGLRIHPSAGLDHSKLLLLRCHYLKEDSGTKHREVIAAVTNGIVAALTTTEYLCKLDSHDQATRDEVLVVAE
jgi:hypothetical protein